MAHTPSPALKKQFQAARTEFKELAINELMDHEKLFLKYDIDQDGFLNLSELKYLMEKLNMPQTHLALKAMIKEVDEDNDGQMAYREFLLIFRYAKTGKLTHDGLKAIASAAVSVQQNMKGVGGGKNFFEAKAAELNNNPAEKDKAYRDQKKKEAEDAKVRKAAFKEKANQFK
eukprot:TRINITY_DN1217_c0_g1_i1.p1 TRINITY_DN1217_c0_g1~~TRINITY_DN1217_c0_g1_i1.p1  ORF type:complete len:173 (-),score=56.77 TRINITY_DN1217_c0_g1_i1:60-578(-)